MHKSNLAKILEPKNFSLLENLSSLGNYTPELGEKLSKGLRKHDIEPDLVAALLTQLELRQKAQEKFGDFASSMLLTRTSLEQASRLPVAALHAARYRLAGCRKVADLGCGLGTESLALAGIGMMVEAFELDETTASCALMNLRAFPEVKVTQADITTLNWENLRKKGVDGAFADPARRDPQGRKLHPHNWSPPLNKILALRKEIPQQNLGIKVSPAITYTELPQDAQVEWISIAGELVEAGIWLGDLRHSPANPDTTATPKTGRSALLLNNQGKVQVWLNDEQQNPRMKPENAPLIKTEDELGKYLFEPDKAIIRAGLTAQAATASNTKAVSEKITYLTGNHPPSEYTKKLGQWFKIDTVIPLDTKQLRHTLQTRQIRSLEVKKRGADINPAQLRKKILSKPDPKGTDLTLIITRLAGRHRALLAQRIH